MTWLNFVEYLCHKGQHICSTIRKHFPILCHMTGFITRILRRMLLVKQKLLTLRSTCYQPVSYCVSYLSILSVLYCVLYIIVSPFVIYLLAITLCVFRCTDCDYPFDIFKDFLYLHLNSLQKKH